MPSRSESRDAIRRLHDQRIEVVVLTGDARAVADALAADLGGRLGTIFSRFRWWPPLVRQGALLPPVFAAVRMSASTVLVALNAQPAALDAAVGPCQSYPGYPRAPLKSRRPRPLAYDNTSYS